MRIVVIAILAIVSSISPIEAVADSTGDIVLVPDNSDKTNPGKERPRMPARPIMGHYGEGVFAVPEWPWLDEAVRLTIVTADGATAVDLDCSGTDLAAGIYVGSLEQGTIVITLDSGTVFTGTI